VTDELGNAEHSLRRLAAMVMDSGHSWFFPLRDAPFNRISARGRRCYERFSIDPNVMGSICAQNEFLIFRVLNFQGLLAG
jgi:hypothetical protein